MLQELADNISSTRLSGFLRDELWVIPTSQSIHIFCVAIVFASATMISVRLLSASRNKRSLSLMINTLVPTMYGALGVLLATGVLQTVAEPRRQFSASAFWWKMVMLLCVATLTLWFARAVRRNVARWDAAETRPKSGRVFAVVSLALWAGIIVCGRFIAYTYTDFQ